MAQGMPKNSKSRLAQINRILALIDRQEQRNIVSFLEQNPLTQIMGAYALSFLPSGREELRSKLAQQADELTMQLRYSDREIHHLSDVRRYNRLICEAARRTKKPRKALRHLPLSQLQALAC